MNPAEQVAKALRGRRCGTGWIARCPAHDDRNPSLSIRENDRGQLLVRCFAGCTQNSVIDSLKSLGLWPGKQCHWAASQAAQAKPDKVVLGNADRTQVALRLWRASAPAAGTLVGTYLACRGILIPIPDMLRFHPGIKHPDGRRWPAMVALVSRGFDGTPTAVHRTYLSLAGTGKAPVEPQKMMLGPCGGGAVRFGIVQPDKWLVVAEGIETTLIVMAACALPGWAALSANGIRSLILPPEAAMVLICADNDANGTGQRAARDAAERFLREGRRVHIAMPPMPGTDFNDLLNPAASAYAEGEQRHVA